MYWSVIDGLLKNIKMLIPVISGISLSSTLLYKVRRRSELEQIMPLIMKDDFTCEKCKQHKCRTLF